MKNEEQFNRLIQEYLNAPYSVELANDFFSDLHWVDDRIFSKKRFSLQVEDIGKMWGKFRGINYEFIDEEQQMKLNSFENFRNDLYRKSLQLINYFHEATHEKQRDRYLLNNDKELGEEDPYQRLMNLEIFCNKEAEVCNYEQRLIEIDAIYNSIFEFKNLLDNGVLPTKEETLSVVLYACVRYFASINGEKHHVYYPKEFSVKSDNLVGYYKNFYKNLTVSYNNREETLNEIVASSDLCSAMKRDIKDIDFGKIEEVLDQKTMEVYQTMETLYGELLKVYKPSKAMLDFFRISSDEWEDKINANNMIRMSALINDDIHNSFSDKTTNKIGLSQKLKEDEMGM